MAFKILSQAFGMITGNFRQLLMIALFPMLIFFLLLGAAMYFSPPNVNMHVDPPNTGMQNGNTGPGVLIGTALQLIGSFFAVMAAVAWHRFVLLEQHPQGWFSAFKLDRVFPYIGYSLLIGIVFILCLLIFAAPPALIIWVAPHAMASWGGLFLGVGILIVLPFLIILAARLSVMLPAAAINKSLTLKQAWTTTRGSSFTMLMLWLLLIIVIAVLGCLSVALFISPLQILGAASFLLLGVFLQILNISIMTTLYGHYVEGRELA